MGIRHWLVASRSPYQGLLRERHPLGQRTVSVRSGGSVSRPLQDEKHEDPETEANHEAPMEQIGAHELLQLSKGAGKGKGKHRRWEHADTRLAGSPHKRRWGRKAEDMSYSESTLPGA